MSIGDVVLTNVGTPMFELFKSTVLGTLLLNKLPTLIGSWNNLTVTNRLAVTKRVVSQAKYGAAFYLAFLFAGAIGALLGYFIPTTPELKMHFKPIMIGATVVTMIPLLIAIGILATTYIGMWRNPITEENREGGLKKYRLYLSAIGLTAFDNIAVVPLWSVLSIKHGIDIAAPTVTAAAVELWQHVEAFGLK